MSEEHPKTRFDSQVTLEDLRERIQKFAEERDWDQVILSNSFYFPSFILHEICFLPW